MRHLVETLCDRLDERLRHFDAEAVSVHVAFEEHGGTHKLYRASVTCHVPQHLAAAHEEGRDPGAALRGAFEELEHQLEKHHPIRRRKLIQQQSAQQKRIFEAALTRRAQIRYT